jgi:hypothetical protein
MPDERGYTPQLGPAAPAAIPLASPADFGAGIGQGLEQLGETLHDSNIRAFKIERAQKADQEQTDFASRFATARFDLDKARIAARANAAPGAAGHTDAMTSAFDGATSSLLDGITETSLRNSAKAQIDGYRSSFLGGEEEFETAKRGLKVATDASNALDTMTATVRTSDDPKTYTQNTLSFDDLANGLTGVPDDVREQLRKEGHTKLADAYLDNMTDKNPAAAIALIDSGAFNDVLNGEQLDRKRAQADVGVRRIASEQQHQAAIAKSALSEQIATVKAQLGAGVDVPDDQLATLSQQAGAVGDTSNAFDLADARVRNNFNKLSKGWTPQQWEGQRNQLRALGDKRTPQQDILLDQVEKRMPGAVAEFDKDQWGWAASNGIAPPNVDLNDPVSIAARRQLQGAISRASGRPAPFFTPAQRDTLRAEAEGSPAGEVDVINKVAAIGGRDAVTEMLGILPSDPKAARLVLLNPTARASALAGIKLLAERPDLLKDNVARQPFAQRLGVAGSLMDGNQLDGVYAVAKGLYVDGQRKAGKDPTVLDQGAFDMSIHRALGGRFDGQHWFGGVWKWGSDTVLLPQTITGRQFESAMTWLGNAKWDAASKNYPVYDDGSKMPNAALGQLIPVLRPDGYYEFHGPNGMIVHRKSGGNFTIDLEPVGRRYPQ